MEGLSKVTQDILLQLVGDLSSLILDFLIYAYDLLCRAGEGVGRSGAPLEILCNDQGLLCVSISRRLTVSMCAREIWRPMHIAW